MFIFTATLHIFFFQNNDNNSLLQMASSSSTSSSSPSSSSSSSTSDSLIHELLSNYKTKRETFIHDIDLNMGINRFVNHIYIINLETDVVRRNYCKVLMQKYNINFEMITVPKITDAEYNVIGNQTISFGEAGCYLSHMYCLQDAIRNQYNNIVIFEDDLVFHKDFHALFDGTFHLSTAASGPASGPAFDILMLGASDFDFYKKKYKLTANCSNIYRPDSQNSQLRGTFAIYYSQKGFTDFFHLRLAEPTFIDRKLNHLGNLFGETFAVSLPNMVVADLSTSNIEHSFWITREFKEKMYQRKCFNDAFDFKQYHFLFLQLFTNTNGVSIDFAKSPVDNMMVFLKRFFRKRDIDKMHVIKNRISTEFFSNDDLNCIILLPLSDEPKEEPKEKE